MTQRYAHFQGEASNVRVHAMKGEESEGGPLKRTATWIAERLANFLLGGDILAPEREGTEIDWDGVEFQKPRRTITAVMPRIQLELALGAANRRLKEPLLNEGCQELITRAKSLVMEENYGAKLSENCAMTVTGLSGGDLEAEVSGSGEDFEVLCDELWGRSKNVQEGTKKPELSQGEAGLGKD